MFENPTKVFPCDCMGEGIAVTKDQYDYDVSEGEVAVSEMRDIGGKFDMRDCGESPYIQLSFWEFGHSRHGRWSVWQRLRMAYQIAFKNRGPWEDMIILKVDHARSFANHILYIITKGEREKKLGEPIVKEHNIKLTPTLEVKDLGVVSMERKLDRHNQLEGSESVHPYFCVQHGGSSKCEESNKRNGFTCPKCTQDDIVEEIKGGSTE